jgi:hypothetical protein
MKKICGLILIAFLFICYNGDAKSNSQKVKEIDKKVSFINKNINKYNLITKDLSKEFTSIYKQNSNGINSDNCNPFTVKYYFENSVIAKIEIECGKDGMIKDMYFDNENIILTTDWEPAFRFYYYDKKPFFYCYKDGGAEENTEGDPFVNNSIAFNKILEYALPNK